MTHLRRYLEEHGVLYPDQLAEAERRQQIYGGSLDTVLLELELLDPVTLGDLLERHGFFDECIVGGGDSAIVAAAYGCLDYVVQRQHLSRQRAARYLAWAGPFAADAAGRVGVVDGDIVHLWHGSKEGRQTADRYRGLSRVDFDPARDIAVSEGGVWTWTSDNTALHDYVRAYFDARDEDGAGPVPGVQANRR